MILTPCIASIDDAAVIVDINVIGNDLVGNIVLQKFGVDSYDVVTRMSPTGNIEEDTDQHWYRALLKCCSTASAIRSAFASLRDLTADTRRTACRVTPYDGGAYM